MPNSDHAFRFCSVVCCCGRIKVKNTDEEMATMESLIGLVNRIQRACTSLGDYGGDDNSFSSLWDALPSVAVVGGQVSNQLFSGVFVRLINKQILLRKLCVCARLRARMYCLSCLLLAKRAYKAE